MRKLGSISQGEEAESIDITPLVDVVFILLIFFIVTTVFVKDKGMDVDRPSQKSQGSVAKESLMVVINKDGEIRVAGRSVNINSLRAYISSRRGIKDEPIVILADKKTSVDFLTDVMDECRLAGATQISLATEQEK